ARGRRVGPDESGHTYGRWRSNTTGHVLTQSLKMRIGSLAVPDRCVTGGGRRRDRFIELSCASDDRLGVFGGAEQRKRLRALPLRPTLQVGTVAVGQLSEPSECHHVRASASSLSASSRSRSCARARASSRSTALVVTPSAA